MSYHNGSIGKALADLFPDIGIERKKMRPQCEYTLFLSLSIISFSSSFV